MVLWSHIQGPAVPPLAAVHSRSWAHFIRQAMVEAFGEIQCHGTKVCDSNMVAYKCYYSPFWTSNVKSESMNNFLITRNVFSASNLLFVESPAGVGWSYSNTSSDYNAGDASSGKRKNLTELLFFVWYFSVLSLLWCALLCGTWLLDF